MVRLLDSGREYEDELTAAAQKVVRAEDSHAGFLGNCSTFLLIYSVFMRYDLAGDDFW